MQTFSAEFYFHFIKPHNESQAMIFIFCYHIKTKWKVPSGKLNCIWENTLHWTKLKNAVQKYPKLIVKHIVSKFNQSKISFDARNWMVRKCFKRNMSKNLMWRMKSSAHMLVKVFVWMVMQRASWQYTFLGIFRVCSSFHSTMMKSLRMLHVCQPVYISLLGKFDICFPIREKQSTN